MKTALGFFAIALIGLNASLPLRAEDPPFFPDKSRLGMLGHSLSGHNSMFVAAFDTRIRCVVSNCGFCSFPTYTKGDLKGWSHGGFMPRIRTVFDLKPKKMPFDFPEVVAALAPQAFLASAAV